MHWTLFTACSMASRKTIALGYIGVHQIFQLALAAHEAGQLERLYCTALDAPGKWGRLLASLTTASSLHPLGSDGLPPERVTELPLPMLSRQAHRIFHPRTNEDYFSSNRWFDRSVARRLAKSNAGLFVGTETCALESFHSAGGLGMKRLLDCPGIPADFLAAEVRIAAADLGIECPVAQASVRMRERVAAEIGAADMIVLCSEVQRDYYRKRGVPDSKMRVNPLWVDPVFTQQPLRQSAPADGRLKALFVGHASVAKGAPYALQAVNLLRGRVTLTVCGGVDEPVRQWAGERLAGHQILGWRPRAELAAVYHAHDVLVFPTMGDSFGFVALEAMSCGLPVIATRNAGAPLPDESWRVPPRDAVALAKRLELYASNRDFLAADGARARAFVKDFTPENYRRRAIRHFDQVLTY
ncbi:MAG: glycosyltransferase family 4 protein [Limisphaerales bacterium]